MKTGLPVKLIVFLACLGMLACERDVDTDLYDPETDSFYYEEVSDYLWDSLTATKITLMGNDAEIEGAGALFSNNSLIIQQAGEYWMTGNLDNGKILVQAGDSGKVKLILDNVNISCSDHAGIFVEQSERTILLLGENSDNLVTDGSSYTDENANAAIFSKSDLALSGNGKLTVVGNYNDGITSKDGLIINSGEYAITAKDDGIRGKDYLLIREGSYTITSEGDAIKSDNENEGTGSIIILYGNFNLNSGGDGIQASRNLSITDGVFNISCTSAYGSGKALKAGNELKILDGDYTIESVDDAVHSDYDIIVENGTFSISTNDDGFHAENRLTFYYADVQLDQCYEGLEAKTLTITDGNFEIHSSDDGLNTASGEGAAMGGFQPGTAGDNNLKVKGGTIAIYANGDGIDINGSVEMTGGTLIVHGPTRSDNGAIDYDGSFVMDGGFLVAAGSSGMAMAPGTSSSQFSVLINFDNTWNANTLFNLQDTEGNNIVTFRPAKTYQSVAISSPELDYAKNYKVYKYGSTTGSESEGVYLGGEYTPGDLYTTFMTTGIVTKIGNTGRPGGPGGPGW